MNDTLEYLLLYNTNFCIKLIKDMSYQELDNSINYLIDCYLNEKKHKLYFRLKLLDIYEFIPPAFQERIEQAKIMDKLISTF